MKEPIRKVVLADGRIRYRLIVDTGRDHTGKRQQYCQTFDKMKDAREELSRIRHELTTGTYVRPSTQTLAEYLDEYVVGAVRGVRESTAESYIDAFRCPRELLGGYYLQAITKADIERLIEYMETSGRKQGGRAGTGLSARTIRMTLGRLAAAFEMAVREGRLPRNVVKLVEPPEHRPRRPKTWSRTQVRDFLELAGRDRLHAAWRVTLYGLRRGEVLGLRWSDIDLAAKTLTVRQARLCINYRTRIEPPKSENGVRTLPLDDDLVAALKKLRRRQEQEHWELGEEYAAGMEDRDWYVPGDAYLVRDASGIPVHPQWYSDEFDRLIQQAKLPRIRLHDSRHTALSLMEKAGVPISIISRWAGHCNPAFTMRTYVHANDEDLVVGAQSLGELYKTG